MNICGTINVFDQVKINNDGIFNLGGEMITEGDLKVNYGGYLVVEGNLIVKGDFFLHNNAALKFLGNDSSIEILGKAKISKKAIIQGDFKDISGESNRFHIYDISKDRLNCRIFYFKQFS